MALFFARGAVVAGFGRGSKQLGCPTANFPEDVVESLPPELTAGVYFGWARVDDGPVLKMVANLGWCPFYNNRRKSLETHILHEFPGDFYGSTLKVCGVGYLRPEANFSSLDELKRAIQDDIASAARRLDSPEMQAFKDHEFFS